MNDNELVSLTDLHRAAGGSGAKHPTKWFANDVTEEFILALSKKLRVQKSELKRVQRARGVGQGTWAHWQIALAYAQWLSPELHMACNEVFKQFIEADASLAVSDLARTKDHIATTMRIITSKRLETYPYDRLTAKFLSHND